MKSKLIYTSALALALLATACSSESELVQDIQGGNRTLTFAISTPTGEKVSYSRAPLHDEPEYAIKSLTLYEYEINNGTSSLSRVMKYPDGKGRDVINPESDGKGGYTFSIIVPAANDGKTYSYSFVANDDTTDPTVGSSAESFRDTMKAAIKLSEPQLEESEENTTLPTLTADILADPDKGIAMSGEATYNGSTEITMSEGITCKVNLTRIVARVDIKYSTPNLKLTKVELRGAPKSGYLFAQKGEGNTTVIPSYEESEYLVMQLNKNVSLPADYLKNTDDITTVELRKAFYLYERTNTISEGEDATYNGASVYIEYDVNANGETYKGKLDIPFRSTSNDNKCVDIRRNTLYTILLGNGDDPISGVVSAKLIVDEWNSIDIDEPLTDEDKEY